LRLGAAGKVSGGTFLESKGIDFCQPIGKGQRGHGYFPVPVVPISRCGALPDGLEILKEIVSRGMSIVHIRYVGNILCKQWLRLGGIHVIIFLGEGPLWATPKA